MQAGRMPSPRGRRWTGCGVATLLMLAAAAPAAAAGEDVKGWFLALDAALTQPNSLDQNFAQQVDFSGSRPRGIRRAIDNDTDATFRGVVGYGFGSGLGSLRVSVWGFDNDDRESANLAGAVYPSVFGYGYYGAYDYLYDASTTAESNVEARTYDLDYVRPMKSGKRLTANWLAGLRVASYEEERSFTGSDATDSIRQQKRFESDAVGIRAGVTAVFGFTRTLSLEGGLAASLLQADTEGESSQTIISPSSTVCNPSCRETNEADDDNIRAQILDVDLRLLWRAGPVQLYLGYAVSSWEGLVKDPVPALGGPGFAEGSERDSISFNSVYAGIRWRFTGKRGSGP